MKFKCLLFGHKLGYPELIFSGGKDTHHDVTRCLHCNARINVFSGTRSEWYEKHGFDYGPCKAGNKDQSLPQ